MTTMTPALIAHDCPDCLSETRIIRLADNIHVVDIFHDPTCPALARIEASDKERNI